MPTELLYDKENRLIQHKDLHTMDVTEYAYDPFSHKKLETERSGTRELYWLDDLTIGEGQSATMEKALVQSGGSLVGEVEDVQGQQNTNYYLTDFLGSVMGETDDSNTVWNQRRYTPYGLLLSGDPFVDYAPSWVGAWGYRYGPPAYAQFYVWHRTLAQETSQWTTRDLLWPEELAYAYVGGNPVTYLDSSGKVIKVVGTDAERRKLLAAWEKVLAVYNKYGKALEICLNDSSTPCAEWGGGEAGTSLDDQMFGRTEVDEVPIPVIRIFIGGNKCDGHTCAYTWKVSRNDYHIHLCLPMAFDEKQCGPIECVILHELIHAQGHIHQGDNKALFECLALHIPECKNFSAMHAGSATRNIQKHDW